jgi:hypothetical protein
LMSGPAAVRLGPRGRRNDLRPTGIRKDGETMKIRWLMGALGLASVVSMGVVGTATAKDEWFVLSEQTIKDTNPSVRITAEEAKWIKEDVKDVKISVEGADVDINKVVLHWKNRPDETVWNVGTVKAGGQTAAKSAPGHEGTLGSVTVNYKILGGAKTAKIKVWGYD